MDFEPLKSLIFYASFDLINDFEFNLTQIASGISVNDSNNIRPINHLIHESNFQFAVKYKLTYSSSNNTLTKMKIFNKLSEFVSESFKSLEQYLSVDYPDFYCVFTNDSRSSKEYIEINEFHKDCCKFYKRKYSSVFEFHIILRSDKYQIRTKEIHYSKRFDKELKSIKF